MGYQELVERVVVLEHHLNPSMTVDNTSDVTERITALETQVDNIAKRVQSLEAGTKRRYVNSDEASRQ